MNFASFPYLVFLALSVLLYYSLGKKTRPVFLLLASWFFYAFFGLGFVALMIFTTAVTFISARLSYEARTKSWQQLFLIAGLCIDLAVFILFKYLHIIDTDIMNWPGWGLQKLLIPVGISFYTFKTLGYCIDVYKRKYAPEPSFLYYALSVSFFPQLIAGPIEKSHNIIAQLKTNKTFSAANFSEGSKLILWGLFKKLVIADSIALVINPVFQDVGNYGGFDFAIALFAFIYQIYADFSGYSDIAIGSARCFGVDLPPNFNKSFFSRNVVGFWGRWHSSLSGWLREYVFNSLGGIARNSNLKTGFNLLVVFLLVGLWHGATINYFFYAIFAFIWMIADILTRNIRKDIFGSRNKRSLLVWILNYASITFMVASLSVFFRPSQTEDSFFILRSICAWNMQTLKPFHLAYLTFIILFFEVLQSLQINAKGHCFESINNFYLRGVAYVAMTFLIILVSSRPDVTFQYFQF